MNIEFTKMHGIGNDFVVIDNMDGKITLSKKQIIFLCDRHKGVGADGVILVEVSDKADCFMNYINADGTPAEMCGNGVRCVSKFVRDNILKNQNNFKIDTRAGVKQIAHQGKDIFTVNMGKASFDDKNFPTRSLVLEGLKLNFISMGNPFVIAIVDDLSKYNFSMIGPSIENNKNFPNRINFILAEQKNDKEFKVRIWERGCGETLACGSGACALYALVTNLKKTNGSISIESPGGKLFLSSDQSGNIIMQGPAVSVFSSIVEV